MAEVTELVSLTLVGLQDTVKPVDGVTKVVRSMVPRKLFKLVRVTVDEPDEPGRRLKEAGLTELVKSREVVAVTVTVTSTECVIPPLVPVTVTM